MISKPGGCRLIFLTVAAGILCGCRHDDIARAHKLLGAGDFLAARRLYVRRIERFPQDCEAHYGLGLSWCAEAVYKTELGLAQALDWYPAIYHVSRAVALGGGQEVRRTLSVLHFNLGATFRREGRSVAAARRLEQALSYDSTLLKALNLLGAIYHESGDLQSAQTCYERVLAQQPNYAMAHFNLGAVAWARGDFATARDCFATALSLDSASSLYRHWLTKAAVRVGTSATSRR